MHGIVGKLHMKKFVDFTQTTKGFYKTKCTTLMLIQSASGKSGNPLITNYAIMKIAPLKGYPFKGAIFIIA